MAKRYVDLEAGESIVLSSPDVTITLEHKTGRRARLCVEAPDQTSVSIPPEKGISALIAKHGAIVKNRPRGD